MIIRDYLTPLVKEQLFEYLLVVRPCNEVNNKILEEKEIFYNEYKEKAVLKTRPFITVANFYARESMEETLLRWIQRICSNQQSFNVTLNNYSGIPPHTIYLRVQNEKPFQKLVNELKIIDAYIKSCSCPSITLVSKPQLNIAQQLPEEVYSRALIQYSHKLFHESFIVKELLLLKRQNKFDECKTVNVFGLPPAN